MAANPEIEKLQEDLGDIRSIASDVGYSLREAFKADTLKDLKGELNSSLLIFGKIDSTLSNTSAVLDKVAKKEISRKDLAKEIGKLATLESKIQSEIQKVANARNVTTIRERQAQQELLAQLNNQLSTLQQQRQEVEKVSKNYRQGFGNALDKGLGSIKDQVMQFFTLSGIIAMIIDGIGKMDKQIIAMSKSLGISRESSQQMRKSMEDYAASSKDGFTTVERLYKAQQGLSEQLGVAVNFSNEERENFARLTELVGLTNEEAGKLAANSAAVGMSTKDYVADLRNSAFQAQRANKIRISDKELLSSISKLSAGILVKFQGNPKALAAAVVQAKKLGATLEQVDKIGDSMLNWEQSIEKELEAELITGKQLNFERARAAALSGDQATLMEEIASQAGSLAEFQGMNVVAQKSLAEAFGMSREEMADMLQKQETINKYGDKAAELNEEQVKEMERRGMNAEQYTAMLENQRTIQEKFNDLITKLQEQIVSLVGGPLGQMLHTLLDVLNTVSLIFVPIRAIFDFTQYIGNAIGKWLDKLGVVGKILKGIASVAIVLAAYMAYGALAVIPIIGPALGLVASAAILAGGFSMLNSQKANDMVSEGGYGKRTLLAPEGAIRLNDKDTVIAGTNLGGGGGGKSGGGGGESMATVVAAIKDLRESITKLASRPITVSLDGEKVGTMVGRRNETGTEQVKNSYSLA